jgi:hypothetical protein
MPQPTTFSRPSDGLEDGEGGGVGCVCGSENDAIGGSFNEGFCAGVADVVSMSLNDGVQDGVSVPGCAAAGLAMATVHTAIQQR